MCGFRVSYDQVNQKGEDEVIDNRCGGFFIRGAICLNADR